MTTFEMAWKRLVAVVATLISVGLISLGLLVVYLQIRGEDEPVAEPAKLLKWDDEEAGVRCYMYGEDLLCFKVAESEDTGEEEGDDSVPEGEWYKRATESL